MSVDSVCDAAGWFRAWRRRRTTTSATTTTQATTPRVTPTGMPMVVPSDDELELDPASDGGCPCAVVDVVDVVV